MVTLEMCIEFGRYALAVGILLGVFIDLLMYGITKGLHLINIKI